MRNKPNVPLYDDHLMRFVLDVFSEILVNLQKPQGKDSLYYDSADVKRMLNISDSTLFRIRKSQSIPHVRIGRKIFYPKSFFNSALKK
jgi:Helix-turn-helix domain